MSNLKEILTDCPNGGRGCYAHFDYRDDHEKDHLWTALYPFLLQKRIITAASGLIQPVQLYDQILEGLQAAC